MTTARRVFIGLQEISGYYSGLEAGLNKIGVAARFVNVHPHPFGYSQARANPPFARRAVNAVLHHREARGVVRQFWALWYLFNVFGLLLWSVNKFDVYVFAWGQTFLPKNFDLWILRAFRKRVVVNIGHGSEARPPYMSPNDEGIQASALRKQTRTMSRHLRRLERHADCIIALPTTAQMLQKDFVNFYALGLPVVQTPHGQPSAQRAKSDGTIRLLHLPSKPKLKGSHQIRVAVQHLREARPEIEYLELTNVSHDEVLRAIADCDVVIDQLWSDIPMAMVGLEAAAYGRPSLIGGYAWDYWEGLLSETELPPAVRFEPADLVVTLKRCVENIDEMHELGRQAHRFVTERWSPEVVARHFEKVIADDIPTEWVLSPKVVRYGYGAGASKETVLHKVSLLVKSFGWESLYWPDARVAYSADLEPMS